MELVERIEANKALISDRLDPDFGLLDELLASRSLTRPEVASVKGVSDSYGRSQKLMGYVSDKGIYDEFLEALRKTEQTHLVNFIMDNEELCPEYGQDWPLTEREISILDTNQRYLIDLLDTCDLLHRLYSLKVVNNRQRDFVSSKPTSHEKNEALLEILRRSSLQNYRKMIYCLHASKQSHIADIFREGGAAETETTAQFENNAIVVGLNTDDTTITKDVIQINLRRPNEISTQQQIPTTMKYEASAAVYCNTMYVAGIGANKDEIWKYNLASGWMKCASLVQGRRRHSAAFIDEVLYVCGGYVDSGGRVLDSVEAYNAVIDKCSTVGKLVHCVESSGNCVPYKNSLYIFGGMDKDYKAMNDVQVYDTKLNTCALLSKPMPIGYNFLRAALWETSVVLVGYGTCFIFNFVKETWQRRKQFKTDVLYFGLVLENERLFVIGGGINETDEDGRTAWKCRDDVRFVPLKNFINDKPIEWKIHAKLPKPALVHSCAKLKLPA